MRRRLAAYRHAASLPGLRVVGIDCHIGSQITQIGPYLDALDRLLDLVEAVEAAGVPLHHVDVGGGLGITYTDEEPPEAAELVARLLQRLDQRGHGHREVLFEPGRSLVGNAGVLLTEVLYLKPGEEKNFCVVDAAMNDMVQARDVPGLDGHRGLRAASAGARHLGCGRPDLRIGRLARPRPRHWPCSPATPWPCCRPAPTA